MSNRLFLMPPKKLTCPTDNNELEYVQTLKGKELIYEYKFIKSETKLGMIMTISEDQLNQNLKKQIFI